MVRNYESKVEGKYIMAYNKLVYYQAPENIYSLHRLFKSYYSLEDSE